MKVNASAKNIADVIARIETDGYRPHLSEGEERTIIGVVGEGPSPLRAENYDTMDGVDKVVRVSVPYKLASRIFHPNDTMVPLNGSQMGGNKVLVIAGPCSVESREQIIETACAVKEAGATALRGGAFKPRTSPYSFQGLGIEGLEMLAEVREEFGLKIVTEVMSPVDIETVCKYSDMLQIGTRNMQNYALLHEAGECGHPVLLKRGFSSTIQEYLQAAEYILSHKNYNVVLCERGIRTFETATRFTFDINAIPVLKGLTHLPVIADPSHGTGKWDLVRPVSRAAIAAGADGVIVEVHPHPELAKSDGAQSLKPSVFAELMADLAKISAAVGRYLA